MWWHTRRNQILSFGRNGRVHLNWRGASVQSTTGSRGVRISGSIAGYTMFRGSVKSTGYPLHSPVSPSLPLPYVTVCHHISTGLYIRRTANPSLLPSSGEKMLEKHLRRRPSQSTTLGIRQSERRRITVTRGRKQNWLRNTCVSVLQESSWISLK